jgi:hypothetical protein
MGGTLPPPKTRQAQRHRRARRSAILGNNQRDQDTSRKRRPPADPQHRETIENNACQQPLKPLERNLFEITKSTPLNWLHYAANRWLNWGAN